MIRTSDFVQLALGDVVELDDSCARDLLQSLLDLVGPYVRDILCSRKRNMRHLQKAVLKLET